MAMDFPKGQRAIAFDRATAFPLDANAYFESKSAADTAVNPAEAAGSKLTAYYFGQQVVVVENNISKLYIIIKVADETTKGYHGELKEVLDNSSDISADGGLIINDEE